MPTIQDVLAIIVPVSGILFLLWITVLSLRFAKKTKGKPNIHYKTQKLIEEMLENKLDVPSQIQKLADLHRSGSITDDEFQAMKAELLKKLES